PRHGPDVLGDLSLTGPVLRCLGGRITLEPAGLGSDRAGVFLLLGQRRLLGAVHGRRDQQRDGAPALSAQDVPSGRDRAGPAGRLDDGSADRLSGMVPIPIAARPVISALDAGRHAVERSLVFSYCHPDLQPGAEALWPDRLPAIPQLRTSSL